MDIPAWVSTQPPAPVVRRHRRPKFLRTALVLGLIASLISSYFIWRDWGNGISVLGSSYELLLTPQSIPLFPAAIVDASGKKITPVTVQGLGTASVIGYAKGANADYYLVSADGKTSNIYTSNPKNAAAGLSQLTNSNTLKVGLAYDAQSGELAYTNLASGTSTVGTVMLLQSGTTTERSLGTGKTPVILKGGSAVVYENDGKLIVENISSGNAHDLFTLPPGGAWAIDPQNLNLVVYMPSTNALQYFSLATLQSASYVKTEKASLIKGTRAITLTKQGVKEFLQDSGVAIVQRANKAPFIPNSQAYVHAHISPL